MIIVSGNLNESQLKAVNTYDAPLLIVAGAGTGKTATITMRIANLIQNAIVPPSNILAVTFTNKAASEMKSRIEKLVGDAVGMWVGTFHSISARIIRMHSRAIGLEPDFLILDEYDRKKLLSGVIKDLDIDDKRFPYKVCSFIISQLKEKCISPQDEEKISNFKYKNLDIASLYQTYQSRLRGMNAVDFDDLIFECVRLFKKEPRILQDLQQRFQFITVDEYQDTNELQHLWLQLLAGSNNNVCCVGDEDQSIYGWRGAKVDYILHFADDFPGAKIVRLEQNYRSTQPILECAMNVISNNKQRYNKVLKSGIHSNEKPELVIVEDDRQENKDIITKIQQLNQHFNVNYKDTAILVRATHQMRGLEDAFIKNGVPYKIIGGIKFYERKEIKDIIAYIRWCYSLKDTISLERIINVPKRGIGEKGFADILTYIAQNGWEIFEGLEKMSANFGNIIRDKIAVELRTFVEFTRTIHNYLTEGQLSLGDIAEKIYFNSGYSQMLQEEIKIDSEATSRIENIRELISSMKQFETIDEFLEHISLVSATDDENTSDSVNIMTMHSAKGLEFLYVFLPAWEEGMFPSQKSLDENGNAGVEEERRLAYVAMTRARKNFFVYTAKQRMTFGRVQLCQPSRFVEEMGDKVEIRNLANRSPAMGQKQRISYNWQQRSGYSYGNNNEDGGDEKYYDDNDAGTALRQLSGGISKRKGVFYSSNDERRTNRYVEAEKKAKGFSVGDKVISEKFGIGVVNRIYGKFYEVQFEGTKQITKDIKKVK